MQNIKIILPKTENSGRLKFEPKCWGRTEEILYYFLVSVVIDIFGNFEYASCVKIPLKGTADFTNSTIRDLFTNIGPAFLSQFMAINCILNISCILKIKSW
jgi:hypothetical protein